MARNPEHAGALHLYVHAVEASPDPSKGVAAADTLRELLPGSGHLVHMPAHIYARVGRWHDAVLANQKAIVADDSLPRDLQAGPGRVPARLRAAQPPFPVVRGDDGRRERGRARRGRAHTGERTSDPQLMRTPGFEAMQNFSLTPLYAAVRFGHWDEVLAMPKPADDLPFMQAMWNYGQAMAAVEPGPARRREAVPRGARAGDDEPGHRKDAGLEPLLADRRRAGRRALRRRRDRARGEEATTRRSRRSTPQSRSRTRCPTTSRRPGTGRRGWRSATCCSRRARPRRPSRCSATSSTRNPENGWSLHGLARALKAQGKNAEAQEAADRFAKAWANADIDLGKIWK